MLCPEVWRFPAPSHEIVQKTGTVELPTKGKDPIRSGIRAHPFNQSITVVLPDVSSIPIELETALADSDHYLVRNVSLQAFINRMFIEGFVKQGKFYAVSFRTRLDTDDCVAIVHPGTLVLHLNKVTFQSLGLEGQVSEFARKRGSKYVVRIDLQTLQPETKFFKRVRECLGRDCLGRFDLQVAWTPPAVPFNGAPICPSSIAQYFADLAQFDKDLKVELMPTMIKTHQECGLNVPVFKVDEGDDCKEYCSAGELIEYMGMLALSCNTEEEEYLNSYDFCGERVEIGNAKVMHWNGFFTPDQVEAVHNAMRRSLELQDHVPWMGMYVQGFSDSPIGFKMRENYFHTDGENCYAVVMNPKGDYLWYQVVGNNKMPK
ncbi:hypothetical protein RP20_CCG026130 [Aedes albopictus]|nr:hypothetical protein RP20_CCG026130 [Aedes albopictus]